MTIKYYSQRDPRWKDKPYTIDGDARETIGYSGCGPTCAAMLIASCCDPAVTPPDMCRFAIDTGTRTANDGTAWAFFGRVAAKYGLTMTQTGRNADALACVQSGGVVIASMGKGRWTSGGHYILWYGVDGDTVLVHDPQSTAGSRSRAPIGDMYAQSKQYFCFYLPQKEAEEDMTQEQFNKLMDGYLAQQKAQQPEPWSAEARAWAEQNGIIAGDGSGNMQYKNACTREMMVVFLYRLTRLLGR